MAFMDNEQLTPREYTLIENEKEENKLNREHVVGLRKLDIQMELAKSDSEIQLKKLEAKWASWLSIPKYIIKLPVLILLGIAYIAHVIMKSEPSEEFWNFIKR